MARRRRAGGGGGRALLLAALATALLALAGGARGVALDAATFQPTAINAADGPRDLFFQFLFTFSEQDETAGLAVDLCLVQVRARGWAAPRHGGRGRCQGSRARGWGCAAEAIRLA
mgnify:CR=1 FL=1